MMAARKLQVFLPKPTLVFLFMGTVFSFEVFLRLEKEGDYQYGNFLKRINGSILKRDGSLISELEVKDDVECASLCVMDTMCLSVNFGVDVNRTVEKTQCELLNWGGTDYRNHLIKKKGFFHMRMETICTASPCLDRMICIPHLKNTEKPYSCICPGCETGATNCDALGLQDKTILDSQITQSHETSWPSYQPSAARLHNTYYWYSYFKEETWMQVNLLKKTNILGVATQGSGTSNKYYIKTYQMSFSNDAEKWNIYKESGIEKVSQIFTDM